MHVGLSKGNEKNIIQWELLMQIILRVLRLSQNVGGGIIKIQLEFLIYGWHNWFEDL